MIINFRRELELDESVTRIVIQITVGMGHYTLYANGNKIESATQWWRYQLYELKMNEELNPGKNVIAIAAGSLYGTNGINGVACGIHVYRTDTSQPKLLPWDQWLCSDKTVAGWTQVDFDAAAGSLREGMEETLTVVKLALPALLRQSLATTNAIENLNGTLRRVSRNVKRWKSPSMVRR